ncbi:hypothetical protein LWI29_027499 [Acer saccharum]|uniref:PGG domain-containing protein n=1 Tax=Acer saccharum TaxID=4024 RepID=A0AA39T6P5_ACESA|nr:hypothetical protein LWI29_027499 [Acer saccharum]
MNPELLKAFRRGNVNQINKLVRGNLNLLSGKTLQGNTSLHLAARLEDKHVINMILEHKPEFLYEKNQNDETPMHVAAKAGNALAIATFATFVGYDNNRTESGDNNRTESVEAGQENIFEMRDKQLNTPLHHAIRNRHNLAAVLLINYAPQTIMYVNDANQVPLSIAIDSSSIYIAWYIIKEHPSSLDYRGPNKVTLLHCAVIRQNYGKTMNFTISNILNTLSKSDIVILLFLQLNLDLVVEILKIKRELIHELDAHGRNPIHYAAVLGNKKIARRLLEADASSSLGYNVDCDDKTPLHLAAEKDQQSVFEILVNGYPDAIVKVDKKQRNILHLAALNGNVDTVRFILTLDEMEYLINSPDVDQNTPLHLAARNFHTEVVNVLSKNMKVNMRATNRSQQTVLAIVESSESSTNPNRDIKKQYLTVKILKEAITARAFCLEDILQDDRQAFYQESAEIDARLIGQHRENKEMSQTLIVMATLIATFTFTAAFTLPGGYQDNGPNEGMAKLVRKSGFKMCVITITIAMTSSMTAAVLCLGQIRIGKDKRYIDVNLIQQAIPLIWIGLVSMSLAFVSGLTVVLSNNMTLAIVVICIGGAFPLVLNCLGPLFFGLEIGESKYFHLAVLLAFGGPSNNMNMFNSDDPLYHLLESACVAFDWDELFYLLHSNGLHMYNNQVKRSLNYGLYRRTSLPLYQLIPTVLAEIAYGRLFTRM